jgi:hypothetical protein
MGAEFYYTGFFNLKKPFAKPENWVWQVAMPAYAQAITSQVENILRKGDLLNEPAYRFKTDVDNALVFVRKLEGLKKYWITGSLQPPYSSDSIVTINLEGKNVKLKIRKQGSTYVCDLSDSNSPVFYQLDGWHEASHPLRWKKEFLLEAELMNNISKDFVVKTEKKGEEGDWSEFISYVSFKNTNTQVIYNIESRKGWPVDYEIWVRSRCRSGQGDVKCNIGKLSSLVSIKDTEWKWFKMKDHVSLLQGKHSIQFSVSNVNVEMDKVLILEKGKTPY